MINNDTTPLENSIDEATIHNTIYNANNASSSYSPLSLSKNTSERVTPSKKLKSNSAVNTTTLPRRSPRFKQVVKRESIAISELDLSNDLSDDNDNNYSHSDMISEMSMEASSPVGMISYRYGRNSSALQRGNKHSDNATMPFRRNTIDKTELNALLDSIDHEDDRDIEDVHLEKEHDNHSNSMRSNNSMDTLQFVQNISIMLGDDTIPSTHNDDKNHDARDNDDDCMTQEKSSIHNLSDISNPTVLSSIPSSIKVNKKKKNSSKKSRKSLKSKVGKSSDGQDVSVISSINLSSNMSRSVDILHNNADGAIAIDSRRSSCNSEDTMNSRRLTVDPNDLIELVVDLSNDSFGGNDGHPRSVEHLRRTNYDNDAGDRISMSNDGNDSIDSIDTVLLMKQVANTLEELDCSVDQVVVHHNYRRRETIDSTDIAMLNEELNGGHDCNVDDVEQRYDRNDRDDDSDGRIDNETVNPGDMLNDSLSTYNSMGESIHTLDLIEHVQATIDEEYHSDAESDLTSMSLLPLVDMLAFKDVMVDDVDNHNHDVGSNMGEVSVASKKQPLNSHDVPPVVIQTTYGALKSCMSSKKKKPRRVVGLHSFSIDHDDDNDGVDNKDKHTDMLQCSIRKTVVFGSPQAAEFNKLSPTTNYTPLDKKQARVLYSMSANKNDDVNNDYVHDDHSNSVVDPITIENDQILDTWDRLTNVSDHDMMDAEVSFDNGFDNSYDYVHQRTIDGCDNNDKDEISVYSSCTDLKISTKRRRRKSKLQPILDISPLDSNNNEEVVVDSMLSSFDRFEGVNQSVDVEYHDTNQTIDITETVNLPYNLTELIHQNQIVGEIIKLNEVNNISSNENASRNISMCSNSKTEEIEIDLQTLMMNISSYNMHQHLQNNSNYISHSTESDADTSNISIVGPHYHERSTDQSIDSCMRSHDTSSEALGFLIGRTSELQTIDDDTSNRIGDDAKLNSHNIDLNESINDVSVQPYQSVVDHHNISTDEFTHNLEGSLQALINNIASSPSSEAHDKSSCSKEISVILKTHDHNEALCNNIDIDHMDLSVVVSQSHLNEHNDDASNPNTTGGSTYDYDGINTSNLDTGRSYSIDTISTDTLGDMKMDMDVENDDTDDIAADLKNSSQTAQLMGRLKALNYDSRSNALLQCSTPSVQGPPTRSRLSIGLKRMSILNESVSHHGGSIITNVHNKRALSAIASTAIKQRRLSIQSTPMIINDDDDCGGYDNHQLTALQPPHDDINAHLMVGKSVQPLSSVSNLNTSVELATSTQQQMEFIEKLKIKLTSFFSSIQSIKIIISKYRPEVQKIVQKTMCDNYHAIYNSTILSKVTIETLYLAWEISSTECNEFLQTAISSVGIISDEDYVLMMIDRDNSDTEQMWLNVTSVNLIAQTSALKSQSRCPSLKADGVTKTSDRFLSKALNLTMAPSSHPSSHPLGAICDLFDVKNKLSEIMRQSEMKLQELTLMVDIINKMTYCSVETFLSNCIKLIVHLSAHIHISLIFHLSKEINDQQQQQQPTTITTKLLIDSIAVDLVMSNTVDKNERAFVSSYFANNICNSKLNGPLCAENLEQLEQPSDICSLLYKVSSD